MAARTSLLRDPAGASPGARARPLLRPGWRAVRHDDHHLQVGLDAPARVVLPDSPGVRRLLTVLAEPDAPWEEPGAPAERHALDLLASAGLLVALPGSALESQLAAAHGPSAPARVTARRASRVALEAPPDLQGPLAALLRTAGVRLVTDGAALTVVASCGPVRRSRLDALVQEGRTHLVLAGGPERWEVGPLVVPGRTACLRCVDAARAETDPRRTVVADQLARSEAAAAPDPVAQATALALAAREVLAHLDGDEPATWSATLTVGVTGVDAVPRRHIWRRHPHCGCAWDVVLAED